MSQDRENKSKEKSHSHSRSHHSRHPEQNSEIFIGHLPYRYTSEELEAAFKDCGEIRNVSIKGRFAFIVKYDFELFNPVL